MDILAILFIKEEIMMDFITNRNLNEWGIEEDTSVSDMHNRDIIMYKSGVFCAEINKMVLKFGMTDEFLNGCLKCLSAKQKSMMIYYILKYKKDTIFSQGDLTNKFENGCRYIPFKELERNYPSSIAQRIQMMIENLASYSMYLGKPIGVGKDKYDMEKNLQLPWLFMPEDDDIDASWWSYMMLQKNGYLDIINDVTSNDSSRAVLTAKAWDRIAQAEEHGKKIFIAMAYNKDFSEKYEDVVKRAIEDCGYEPMIIKDKEHNEYIPSEIEYEISTSVAVIGDLTGENNGVYYETGYARGENIPVIFTCKKEDGENESIHFDIRQINTIFWQYKDMDELGKRLIRRIKATLLERKR